jgi:hypothetical protein
MEGFHLVLLVFSILFATATCQLASEIEKFPSPDFSALGFPEFGDSDFNFSNIDTSTLEILVSNLTSHYASSSASASSSPASDRVWHDIPGHNTTDLRPRYRFYCETTSASPVFIDVYVAALKLARIKDLQTCTQNNRASDCKEMIRFRHGALGICGKPYWGMPCDMAANYYYWLMVRCVKKDSSTGGVAKVGGYMSFRWPYFPGRMHMNMYRV